MPRPILQRAVIVLAIGIGVGFLLAMLGAALGIEWLVSASLWFLNGIGLFLFTAVIGVLITRFRWKRKIALQDARLNALPNWERDELGDTVAATLDADFRRNIHQQSAESLADSSAESKGAAGAASASVAVPEAQLLTALCRPLPGSTVIERLPALPPELADVASVAVYGSRVAVVYNRWPVEDSVIQQTMPEGVTVGEFLLQTGDELQAPEAGAPTVVTPMEPHELAAFIAAGAPANGDAIYGKAADLHERVLRRLLPAAE